MSLPRSDHDGSGNSVLCARRRRGAIILFYAQPCVKSSTVLHTCSALPVPLHEVLHTSSSGYLPTPVNLSVVKQLHFIMPPNPSFRVRMRLRYFSDATDCLQLLQHWASRTNGSIQHGNHRICDTVTCQRAEKGKEIVKKRIRTCETHPETSQAQL